LASTHFNGFAAGAHFRWHIRVPVSFPAFDQLNQHGNSVNLALVLALLVAIRSNFLDLK